MKTSIKKGTSAPYYPRLKVWKRSNCIVLFTGKCKGMCVHKGADTNIGDYSGIWNEEEFKDFNGEISLKNDK